MDERGTESGRGVWAGVFVVVTVVLAVYLGGSFLMELLEPAYDEMWTQMDVMEGWDLTAEESAALERELADDPDDLSIRAKLLGYYGRTQFEFDDRHVGERLRHVKWLIENEPGSALAGSIEAEFLEYLEPDAYREVSALWAARVEELVDDADVQVNAANYFLQSESELAEACLLRALELRPDEEEWWDRLGHLYDLHLSDYSGDAYVERAGKAMAAYLRAYELQDADEAWLEYLIDATRMAFEAREFDAAGEHAQRVLERLDGSDWNARVLYHDAHSIWGRVLVRGGDVEGGVEHLRLAAEENGLKSEETDGMIELGLAEDLALVGRVEEVAAYLESAEPFFADETAVLRFWREQLAAGFVPIFDIYEGGRIVEDIDEFGGDDVALRDRLWGLAFYLMPDERGLTGEERAALRDGLDEVRGRLNSDLIFPFSLPAKLEKIAARPVGL